MAHNENTNLHTKVKTMMIKALRLKVDAEDIKNEAPLFNGGLGLDSVDALELVIAIEKEFGLRIPDASLGAKVLVSVNTIVDFVKSGKTDKKE